MAGLLNRGGGLNGCGTKKKIILFNVRKKVPMANKPRGGGKGLNGRATKKKTFFAASLTEGVKIDILVFVQ